MVAYEASGLGLTQRSLVRNIEEDEAVGHQADRTAQQHNGPATQPAAHLAAQDAKEPTAQDFASTNQDTADGRQGLPF